MGYLKPVLDIFKAVALDIGVGCLLIGLGACLVKESGIKNIRITFNKE